MDKMFESDEGFLNKEDITGKISESIHSAKTSFKPWHKPRKQLIRDKQWWFHLNRLLKECSRYNTVNSIKYFGLPGGDLLDVHYIVKQLETSTRFSSKKLLVHGFINNLDDKSRADVRLSELLDFENFDNLSKVDRFNFQDLSDENSVALDKVRNQAGYHFVNLDFCDSVFNQNTLNALVQLLHEQFKILIGIPWLFCITTRADNDGIASDLYETLSRAFDEEFREDEALIKAIEEHYKKLIESVKEKSLTDMNEEETSQILQICFIYWTIKRAHAGNSKIQLVSAMNYNICGNNEYPDMYSYVFRFEKVDFIPPDSTGLSTRTANRTQPLSEQDIHSDKYSSIEKFANTWNVDEALLQNADMLHIYKEQIKGLLSDCGWDISLYDQTILGV